MKVRLICLSDEEEHDEIILDQFPVLVGRNLDVAIRIDDAWVSRFHCKIDEIDGRLVVRDLGSRNGTFINGSYIVEAPLMPDDQLTIGNLTFLVAYDNAVVRQVS